MDDEREVTSKPCGICTAVVLGVLLFGGGLGFGGWNEYRNVATDKMLQLGRKHVVDVHCGPVQPGNDGKLIHFECPVTGQQMLGSNLTGIKPVKGLVLISEVEIYQWVQKEEKYQTHRDGKSVTRTRKVWRKEWARSYKAGDGPQGTLGVNPTRLPASVSVGRQEMARANDVKAGVFELPDRLLNYVMRFSPVQPSCEACPPGVHVLGQTIYYTLKAEEAEPQVGDVRQTFTIGNADFASVLAQQRPGGELQPWISPHDSDYSIFIAEPTAMTAAELLDAAEQENEGITWLLRLVTLGCTIGGIFLFLSPLQYAADAIPIVGDCLGGMVGMVTCLFSCLLGSMCWMAIAALAWLRYRPMIGVPLLLATCVLCGALYYYRETFQGKRREGSETYNAIGDQPDNTPLVQPPGYPAQDGIPLAEPA